MLKLIIAIIVLIILGLYVVLSSSKKMAGKPSNNQLAVYEERIKSNANDAVAYMEIARDNITAYPEPYDSEKALRDISKAIEIDPSLVEAYKLRSMLYFYTFKNKEMALADVEKILQLAPNDDFALDMKKDINN